MKYPLLITIVLATASFVSTLQASALDRHLVARWSFDRGSLRADTGDFSLETRNVGREVSLSPSSDAVTLDSGVLLSCAEINSEAFPGLRKAVTLWARLKLEGDVTVDGFLFGFSGVEGGGDWNDMALALLMRPEPANSLRLFSKLDGGETVSSGSRSVEVESGRFVTIALVFDGANRTATCYVDGKPVVSRFREKAQLKPFNNFSIGRLKLAGGVAVTVDELRVYSVALPAEWVAEIEPSTGAGTR